MPAAWLDLVYWTFASKLVSWPLFYQHIIWVSKQRTVFILPKSQKNHNINPNFSTIKLVSLFNIFM